MPSTAQNMLFLETQLEQYLHEHYESAGILYTKPVGFRLPYQRGLTDLERNMKFVEVQLDKYLHTHESVTPSCYLRVNDPFPSIDAVMTAGPVTNRELSQTYSLAGGPVYMDRVTATGVWDFSAVSTDPPSGATLYFHNSGGLGIAAVLVGETNCEANPSDGYYHTYTTACNAGQTVVATCDARTATSSGTALSLSCIWYNAAGGIISQSNVNSTPSAVSTTWGSHTFSASTAPANTASVSVSIELTADSSRDLDLGNIQVSLTGTNPTEDSGATLYWTPKGFRFPYDWKRSDAINHNRRFLETELSKDLHKHEEA